MNIQNILKCKTFEIFRTLQVTNKLKQYYKSTNTITNDFTHKNTQVNLHK
jgi:hypothetical protein